MREAVAELLQVVFSLCPIQMVNLVGRLWLLELLTEYSYTIIQKAETEDHL